MMMLLSSYGHYVVLALLVLSNLVALLQFKRVEALGALLTASAATLLYFLGIFGNRPMHHLMSIVLIILLFGLVASYSQGRDR